MKPPRHPVVAAVVGAGTALILAACTPVVPGSTGAAGAPTTMPSPVPPVTSTTAPPVTAPPVTATTATTATSPATSVTAPAGDSASVTTAPPAASGYEAQIARLRAASTRNTAADTWPFRDTAQADIPDAAYLGPRSEYSPLEGAFPAPGVGSFRLECEFSHFAYDDPLVFPGKPGASHLHMFFGNTDVNAFTTADSLRNSGGSTCNGFVRNGYWAPAVFDASGNVRVPEYVRVYYKGFYDAIGEVQAYPEGMAMVSDNSINETEDGANSFECIDTYGGSRSQRMDTMPDCVGGQNADNGRNLLEVNVKFSNCWNGLDPADYAANLVSAQYSWYSGICPATHPIALPNLEYRMKYMLKDGERSKDWFIASDVDPMSLQRTAAPAGSSAHADWWGAWDPDINRQWLANCVNVDGGDCGEGFLDNSGNAGAGPTLKRRAEYTGATEVPAAVLFDQLCQVDRDITRPEQAAYCDTTATMDH